MKEDKVLLDSVLPQEHEIESYDGFVEKKLYGNKFGFLAKLYKTNSNGLHLITDAPSQNILLNIVNEEPSSLKVMYNDLPTDVQLHILSFLDVLTLCCASRVCKIWDNVANDHLLWEKKLKFDSHKWQMIDHLSHPWLYKETNPEINAKYIYLKCCPECRCKQRKGITFPIQLPNLKYYFGFAVPRVVMFGAGLDSSGLVRRILWDKVSPFEVKGMFPGQFEGIGSGVTLQYTGGSLDLITLYALSKAEREQEETNRERRSKLLVSDNNNKISLSQPIKELCSTIDAFIYIVNATNVDRVTYGSTEFRAMIDDRWLQPKIPVLIMCVVPDASVTSVSSLEVANKLNLLSLSRPWQVRQCHNNSLYGFMPGVSWLNRQVMCL